MAGALNDRLELSCKEKVAAAAQRLGIQVHVEGHVVFVQREGKREVLCLPAVPKRFWQETWLALRERTGEKARGWEAVAELLWDPRRNAPTALASTLLGGTLLAMGLYAFAACADAMLSGQQYAGPTRLRSMGNRMPADIGAPVSLILVMGGAGTIWVGLANAYPALAEQRWFRWLAAALLGALFLLFVALALYVLLARLLR
jgi:hypothetical protein